MFKQKIEGTASGFINEHRIEPKNIYMLLEMLSITYLSDKSTQMDIFHKKNP